MDVTIKKVGQRDDQDRFVLVDAESRKVLTVNDVSERALRRFFRKRGAGDELIDACLDKARRRYDEAVTGAAAPVDEARETIEDDDLLFELGLDDDSDENIH